MPPLVQNTLRPPTRSKPPENTKEPPTIAETATSMSQSHVINPIPYASSSTALGAASLAADTFKDSGYDSYGSSNLGPLGKAIEADTTTLATDNQSLNMPEASKEQLITAVVEELLDSLIIDGDRTALTTTKFEEICGLLKECSVEMGHCASSKLERDTVSFIRQQRRPIARLLQNCWNSKDMESGPEDETDNDAISVDEKIRRWHADEETKAEGTTEDFVAADFFDLEDESPIPELPYARAFLTTHPSYTRLIFRLTAILEDKVCEGYRRTSIRQTILRHLAASRPRTKAIRSVRFNFPAPSRSFLAKDALFRDGQSLANAVVVAGGLDDAFATTCADYVKMSWGQDGLNIFKKMQEALESEIQASWIKLGESANETSSPSK